MSAISGVVTDEDVCRAAIERLGCADAGITRCHERPWDDRSADRVLWFGLSIRRTSDGPWEVVGRRRTKSALLQFAERGPVPNWHAQDRV
jgi:hypothetical protein